MNPNELMGEAWVRARVEEWSGMARSTRRLAWGGVILAAVTAGSGIWLAIPWWVYAGFGAVFLWGARGAYKLSRSTAARADAFRRNVWPAREGLS